MTTVRRVGLRAPKANAATKHCSSEQRLDAGRLQRKKEAERVARWIHRLTT
jgi:hypothetical protein